MKFERKHSVLLLAVAYWVAHSVLIVVNVAIAALLGSLGWRAWRATRHS